MAVISVRIKKDEGLNLSGRSLQILVGTGPSVPFSVHEGLIRNSSDFFDKAMSSDWKESRDGTFELPDEDPETFHLYLHWLYSQKLPVIGENQCNAEYFALAKAVVLEDKLQDSDFVNAAVDAIIDKSRCSRMDGQALDIMAKYIYENTAKGFKARKLFVDFYMNLEEREVPVDPPLEFAIDLLRELVPRRSATYDFNPSTMSDTCSLRVAKNQAVDISGGSIQVIVGTEAQVTFSIHEILIRKASDFFNKALSHEWKESKERSVSLPETDPDTFELYLQWLYFRSLPVKSNAPGNVGNMDYLQLAKAYVLGDLLQDFGFNDAVIDAMIDKSRIPAADGKRWYPGGPVVACIYNNTPASSEARRILIDMYVNFGNGHWLQSWAAEDLPNDFLRDLSTALLDKRPCRNLRIEDEDENCKYHRHGATKECYRNGPGAG